MLKDLAVEIAVLVGLVVCVFWFFPFLMYPFRSSHPIAELLGFLSFLGFIGLLAYGIRHLKRLFSNGKTKHAMSFTVTLIATIGIFFIVFWILFQPQLV